MSCFWRKKALRPESVPPVRVLLTRGMKKLRELIKLAAMEEAAAANVAEEQSEELEVPSPFS